MKKGNGELAWFRLVNALRCTFTIAPHYQLNMDFVNIHPHRSGGSVEQVDN